jgi:hypothetical protein
MESETDELQCDRVEWWGGSKDVTLEGLLRPLLDHSVVRLEHAVIDERSAWDQQDPNHLAPQNIVFSLADGPRWELLDAQYSERIICHFYDSRKTRSQPPSDAGK